MALERNFSNTVADKIEKKYEITELNLLFSETSNEKAEE